MFVQQLAHALLLNALAFSAHTRTLSQYGHEPLDLDTSTLWFAGKQMMPEKKLSDYLGRHEKTKVSVYVCLGACFSAASATDRKFLLLLMWARAAEYNRRPLSCPQNSDGSCCRPW